LILDESDGFVGGGALINKHFILTAAHKVFQYVQKPKALKIRLGDWDVGSAFGQNPEEKYAHQERAVSRIIIQPNFNINNVYNDLALLYLEYPAELSGVVSPICLPKPKQNFDQKK
jgi:hypothetical protein